MIILEYGLHTPPEKPYAGSHELLPKLMADIRGPYVDNSEKRRFLRASLVQFLGALEDIKHFYGWGFSTDVAKIEGFSKIVLKWLELAPDNRGYRNLPGALRHLEDALLPSSNFSREFDDIFQWEVHRVKEYLEGEAKKKGGKRLVYEFSTRDEVGRCKVLTNVRH